MDNLIRAKLNLPFIQLDYSNVTGTVTDTGSATVGGSRTVTNTEFAQNAALGAGPGTASFSPDHVVARAFNIGGSGQRVNQLTITAQPYTASDLIYKAYVAFARDDNLFVEGKENEKPPADAHIWRACGNRCYWVPKCAAKAFLALYLMTTVSRQVPAEIPTSFETTLQSVVEKTPLQGTPGWTVSIRLKGKVPNDSGILTIRINGMETKFRVQPLPNVPVGRDTNILALIYDATDVDGFVKAASDQPIRIHLDHYSPGYRPAPLIDTEPIRSQLELQRLDTFIK